MRKLASSVQATVKFHMEVNLSHLMLLWWVFYAMKFNEENWFEFQCFHSQCCINLIFSVLSWSEKNQFFPYFFPVLKYFISERKMKCNVENTLEHAQVHTASHRNKLPRHTSVDGTNNLRHTLKTCPYTAQTRSNYCRSIKVNIIFYVLRMDSFFYHFCCLSSEQVYFKLLWIKFYSALHISDQLHMCLMRTHSQ